MSLYLEYIINAVFNFFTSSKSKFFYLYFFFYVFVSFFLVHQHGFIKRFKEIFPARIYRLKTTAIDFKIILINLIIILPAMICLVGGSGWRMGIPKSFVTDTARWMGTNLGGYDLMIESTWVMRFAYTLGFAIVLDFAYYLAHWAQHKVPFLWEMHKVHHSATALTPLTTYRTHPLSMLFQNIVIVSFLFPYVILAKSLVPHGLKVITIYNVGFMFFAYNMFALFRHSHVWLSFGKLDYLFLSPVMHQLHHSPHPKHINRNHGLIFSVWDVMFGTAYIPKGEEPYMCGITMDPEENEKYQSLFMCYVDPVICMYARIKARFK